MQGDSGQPELQRIVIAGAGQAGVQAALSLRDEGYTGRIDLIGDEPGLPYQRPPLSKAYLTGKMSRTSLELRPQDILDKLAIHLTSDCRIERIDPVAHTVRTTNNSLAYDHLIIATGTRNRPLPIPGHTLDGVHQLRTAADADLLRPRLATLKHIVIIGAGFIGLEVAAVAAALGAKVTVLEAAHRPMARALSEPMSDFFRAAHETNGINLAFGTTAARIEENAGRVRAVETADGKTFPADVVLIGIGVIPNTELAAEAGLAINNGIVVDEMMATADPAISAIGDCASFPQFFAAGTMMRIESVQNAADQGRCVAARLTGKPKPYRAVPWFWSDQGPLKLQMAGLSMPHDHAVLRGDPASGAFSVFCFRDDKLVGVESVNKPADHMIARRLIGAGTPLTPAEATDLAFDLKAHAAAAPVAA